MKSLCMISLNDRGNLGARQIVAYAKHAGAQASLINFGQYDHDKYEFSETPGQSLSFNALMSVLHEIRPDVIGISYRSAMASLAAFIGEGIRRERKAIIIAGGIGSTSDPEGAAVWADHVCIGEGDRWIGDVLSGLAPLPKILRPQSLVGNLDTVPFPDYTPETTWTIVRGEVTNPDGRLDNDKSCYPLLTSRGCPRACSYCHNSTVHRLYASDGKPYCRQRSVSNVLAEIAWAKSRWNMTRLSIYDDLFIADPIWIWSFARELPKVWQGRFWCMTHPTYIREDVIRDLVHVGLEEVCLGVQSGSDRILKLYRRGTSREQILEACKILNHFDIKVKIDLISANPLERAEDIAATLDLLQKLPRDQKFYPGLSRLTIFPGSEIGLQVTQFECDAMHNEYQDWVDGILRAAFVPRWYNLNLVDAVQRYGDFVRFKKSRTWPESKGPRSDEFWAPLSAWLDAGAPR